MQFGTRYLKRDMLWFVGEFDDLGVAEGRFDADKYGPIAAVRLVINSSSKNWVIISEVCLYHTKQFCFPSITNFFCFSRLNYRSFSTPPEVKEDGMGSGETRVYAMNIFLSVVCNEAKRSIKFPFCSLLPVLFKNGKLAACKAAFP